MRTRSLLFLVAIFFLSCSYNRIVHFSSDTFLSAGKEHHFEITIPRKAKSVPKSYLQEDVLKQFESKNGTLYISLDISYSNSPNKNNWLKCSTEKEKCEEGKQSNGKYWREILKNGVVVGYYDVLNSEKVFFDKAIDSFKKL